MIWGQRRRNGCLAKHVAGAHRAECGDLCPTAKFWPSALVNDEDTSSLSLNADLFDLSTVDLTSNPPNLGTVSSAGRTPRSGYIIVALLLPDATVWLAGGNRRGARTTTRWRFINRRTCSTDGTMATRPSITSAPSSSRTATPSARQPGCREYFLGGSGAQRNCNHAFGMTSAWWDVLYSGKWIINGNAPANGNIARLDTTCCSY